MLKKEALLVALQSVESSRSDKDQDAIDEEYASGDDNMCTYRDADGDEFFDAREVALDRAARRIEGTSRRLSEDNRQRLTQSSGLKNEPSGAPDPSWLRCDASRTVGSVAVVPEISLWSPGKLLIYVINKSIYRMKIFK